MSATGVKLSRFWRVMKLGILLVIYVALTSCTSPVGASPQVPVTGGEKLGPITIKITNLNPKADKAVARVIETNESASLNAEGKLAIPACDPGQTISVWAPGYYVKTFQCTEEPPHEYSIELEPLDPADNPHYPWIDAEPRFNSNANCARCHSEPSPTGLNEYAEWEIDGHSRTFISPYFWTTYMGTNVHGNPSQTTRWGFSPDGSRYRLPADPNQPDYGPGYRLDNPNGTGNCAFCHAPAAIGASNQEIDLSSLISGSGGQRVNVVTEGVTCDVCHKVIGVSLDEQGLPFMDRPGVLSFSFLRPAPGLQFIAGPWSHPATTATDIKRTCAPIFSASSFCAPCHYAKFSGVEIYGSYKEWLDSPYSEPNDSFRSCQDCHMASTQPVDGTSPAARDACSAVNHSFREFSHNMLKRDNLRNPILIQGAATVEIDATREEGKIKVNVVVVNTRAGHKFPTDSPLRHLVLVVDARDQNGTLLTQIDGPTIPAWGGSGNQLEDFAGQPGTIFANILKDKDTSTIPAVDYWNPVLPAWQGSDTRLRPNADTPSQYFFVAPSQGAVTVIARLIYRSAFIEIARQKGWPLQDILVNWDEAIVQ